MLKQKVQTGQQSFWSLRNPNLKDKSLNILKSLTLQLR